MTDTYTTTTLYQRLEAVGFKPSDDALRLYDAIQSKSTPDADLAEARASLKAAVIAGDKHKIDAAQAAVTSAANIGLAWESYEAQRRDFGDELLNVIAEPAFAFVRDLYDDAGARFARALATTDPDTPTDDAMRDGSKAERDAWLAAPGIVAELDCLGILLGDVVKLRGRSDYRSSKDIKYARYPLGLLVKMNGAHPRRVAEAWCWEKQPPAPRNPKPPTHLDTISGGRGGKWAAMARLGAELAVPCDSLADYRPFDLAPLTRTKAGTFDPHDGPEQWATYQRHLETKAQNDAEQRRRIRNIGGV